MLPVVALNVAGWVIPALRTAGIPSTTLQAPAMAARLGLRMAEAAADVDVSQIHKDADAVFACIDVDGNGSISLDELVDHLTSSGYKKEAVEKIFEKLDTDKSGELSIDELRDGMVNYTPLRKAPGFGNYNEEFKDEIYVDADTLFDSIDEDGDGEITDMELRVHLREFSKFTDKAITRLFTFLDIDSDGGITRDELRSAFVSYSALRQAIGSGPNYK